MGSEPAPCLSAAETGPSLTQKSEVDLPLFLRQEQRKDLLRFTTAGSVDDGKSTLIGRLLYDSKNVYEDNLRSVTKASVNRSAGPIDFSLLTDGLRAEREQGITIDVAYRYFATAERKYIIADTPGHEQYTRNMATGASTADAAIILVDARHGVLPQSRRHLFIASLLGIQHFIIAINKMDLVGYAQPRFEEIRSDFRPVLEKLQIDDAYFLPISALAGDNVVEPSNNMAWFRGLPLLGYLDSLRLEGPDTLSGFRFPVQHVIRPDQNFRGYSGQIAAGTVRSGMPVIALPAGQRSKVKSIVTFDGDLPAAAAPYSVTLTLEDQIDIGRGDMLCSPEELPHVSTQVEAMAVWMNEQALELNRRYLLKHTGQILSAEVKEIEHRVNINTLKQEPAASLGMNEIGKVVIETARPLFFDSYRTNRVTGSFILIDTLTNATVGAGMLLQPAQAFQVPRVSPAAPDQFATEFAAVTQAERLARYRHSGYTVELGGRERLATLLERILFDRGCLVVVLRDAQEQTLRELKDAGIITLVLGRKTAELSPDDEEASKAIVIQMEEAGVLLPFNLP